MVARAVPSALDDKALQELEEKFDPDMRFRPNVPGNHAGEDSQISGHHSRCGFIAGRLDREHQRRGREWYWRFHASAT